MQLQYVRMYVARSPFACTLHTISTKARICRLNCGIAVATAGAAIALDLSPASLGELLAASRALRATAPGIAAVQRPQRMAWALLVLAFVPRPVVRLARVKAPVPCIVCADGGPSAYDAGAAAAECRPRGARRASETEPGATVQSRALRLACAGAFGAPDITTENAAFCSSCHCEMG